MKLRRSAAQAAAAQQQLALLHEARSKGVRLYRANPRPWPDGIGAWYRAEDWTDEGELIATGEARARALDWWANDRAKGRPCPPLALVPGASVNTPAAINVPKLVPVNTSEAPVVDPVNTGGTQARLDARKEARRKAAKLAMRDLRERREREKAEREQEPKEPKS
jgi:hypothetical protein